MRLRQQLPIGVLGGEVDAHVEVPSTDGDRAKPLLNIAAGWFSQPRSTRKLDRRSGNRARTKWKLGRWRPIVVAITTIPPRRRRVRLVNRANGQSPAASAAVAAMTEARDAAGLDRLGLRLISSDLIEVQPGAGRNLGGAGGAGEAAVAPVAITNAHRPKTRKTRTLISRHLRSARLTRSPWEGSRGRVSRRAAGTRCPCPYLP